MAADSQIQLKTRDEIECLRRANAIVYEVLMTLQELVRPGITNKELDRKAEELTLKHKAQAAFLGYPAHSKNVAPFPGTICASVNECIVHGIPNDHPLREGDILSIDYGCKYQGWYGDSAITVPVGQINAQASKLLEVTQKSLNLAIEECQPGRRIGDISNVVQQHVEINGFSVVREFVGHGIGRNLHEPPHVPNFGRPGQGRIIRPGLVLAIEPMVTAGSFESRVLADGWSAVAKDGSLAAHFEHSVAITENGPLILSRP